ncbi:hypothetical protein [Halobacillus sp. Nhm2S1]|uniref:hypothetical protein n=1 Tax=Halobacillus sp. Nhm2S1 TaxID=2866716 RepID=UPI001C731EE4|nr:hypothetical protein [Halobacillus sp. Nhm2S1]MBX0358222.1 hypothetical protein [Halobacillus sp. Nhm2S1]
MMYSAPRVKVTTAIKLTQSGTSIFIRVIHPISTPPTVSEMETMIKAITPTFLDGGNIDFL